MTYKVIVSLRTQNEIENAIEYYKLYSDNTPQKFVTSLTEAYSMLATNPFLLSVTAISGQ